MSTRTRHSIALRRKDRELADLILFLDALSGDEPPGGLIEVRYREPHAAMSQRFHRVDRPELAAHLIRRLARRHAGDPTQPSAVLARATASSNPGRPTRLGVAMSNTAKPEAESKAAAATISAAS